MDESPSTTAPVADGVVVPRCCTLDGFTTEVSETDGIGLADLDPITTLLVRTQNSLYEIVVVQPRQKAVVVQGGPFFPQATRAVLSGSNFGGSLLKVAWVGIGLHMEFRARGPVDHHVTGAGDHRPARACTPWAVLSVLSASSGGA